MARDYYEIAYDMIQNPEWMTYFGPILLLMEAVFNALIIRTVNYTEIDWVAYMQQVKQYIAGERDYTKISGQTGPLVYPALHVYIYRFLHDITYGGHNITLAQVIFLFLYVLNIGLVFLCYREARAPPWVYPMLTLSKRLHSIYVLRCFNDGFAATFFFLTIYLFQKRQWSLGSIAFSLGIAVKMSMLLALPAVAVILYQAVGPTSALGYAARMFFIQVLLGSSFLRENWRGYLTQSFDFSRQFLYEWTVNWKFIPEEIFLSRQFSTALLIVHVSLLILFITTRWLKPIKRPFPVILQNLLFDPTKEEQAQIRSRITSEYILTTMLTANAIGMLCARSLHYQFFALLGWATPYLLWRANLNPLLVIMLWFGQELAWLQYPSNELSSKIVVGVLAAVVVEIWLATDDPSPTLKEKTQATMKQILESRGQDRPPPKPATRRSQANSKS